MIELKKDEIKQIQIDILNVVSDFCDNNDLTYYLGYGTLIGAVRHQGYIPWDDDIDIALSRTDYEFFISNFNGYVDNFEAFYDRNSEWFPYPFAKVAYQKSILEEKSENMIKSIGINIDVFPLDDIPCDIYTQKKLFSKIKKLRNILILKSVVLDSNRSLIKNIVLLLSKVMFIGFNPNRIAREITKTSKKYSDKKTEKLGNVVWGYGESEIISKEYFKNTKRMKFHEKMYNVPSGYHEWLLSNYGNYMELPPIEKQVTHHKYKAYIL